MHGKERFFPQIPDEEKREFQNSKVGGLIWRECGKNPPAGMAYQPTSKYWGRWIESPIDPYTTI